MNTTFLIVIGILTSAAWLLTFSTSQNMGLLMQIGVPMSLGMEGWAGTLSFLAFTSMWLVMMVAMMLPSTTPTLLLHHRLSEENPRRLWRHLSFCAQLFSGMDS